MKKRNYIISFLSGLILCLGLFFLINNSLIAYHNPSHEGSSCGECHCDPGDQCISDPHSCFCEGGPTEKQINKK